MPEPAVAHDRDPGLAQVRADRTAARQAQAVTQDRVAHVERGEGAEQVAADIHGNMKLAALLHQQLERRHDRTFRAARAERRRPGRHGRRDMGLRGGQLVLDGSLGGDGGLLHLATGLGGQIFGDTFPHGVGRVLAGHGQHVFAVDANINALALSNLGDLGFDEVRVAFLDHQYAVFVLQEVFDLVGDQGINQIEAQHGHIRVAVGISCAEPAKGPLHHRIGAALGDDAEAAAVVAGEQLIDLVLAGVVLRGRQPIFELGFFVGVGRRRQHDSVYVIDLFRVGRVGVIGRDLVVLGGEFAGQMASADAHIEEHRHLGDFGNFEGPFGQFHHLGQVIAGIDQRDG